MTLYAVIIDVVAFVSFCETIRTAQPFALCRGEGLEKERSHIDDWRGEGRIPFDKVTSDFPHATT